MNKQDILAMKPGPELDKLVGRTIDPGWDEPSPFSTDIAAAWMVVEHMKKELFSGRLAFLSYLQEQTFHEISGTGEKVTVAWPDVFWYVTPETICKAALLAIYCGIEEVIQY